MALTLLLLGLPAILVLTLGQRAQTPLPKVRDWMNDNSWVISEVVLLFFILITINSLSAERRPISSISGGALRFLRRCPERQ